MATSGNVLGRALAPSRYDSGILLAMKEGQPRDGFLVRTGRRALAGVKGVEHFGREIADGFQVIEEGLTATALTVTVVPWLDRGLLALRSYWEKEEYEHLQSKGGAKKAGRAEAGLHQARTAVSDAKEKIPLAVDTAKRHIRDKMVRINELIGAAPEMQEHTLSLDNPLDFESILDALETLETDVHLKLSAHAEKNGGTIQDADFKENPVLMGLRNILDESLSLTDTMRAESARVAEENRVLERAEKTVGKAVTHKDLPRTRVLEREELMAKREKFSDLVYRVRLKKIEGRRKLAELGEEIEELRHGRHPGEQRRAREYQDMRKAQMELTGYFFPQTQLFESEEKLNAKIKGTRKIDELGRRPRLYDVEVLLLGLSIPIKVRESLAEILYAGHAEKDKYQNLPADNRHSFISSGKIQELVRVLKDTIARHETTNTEQVSA